MANNVQTCKTTMTGKERILASLRGQPVDRLCWSPLIDRYFIRSLPSLGYPALNVPDTVRLIKADVMERHCPVVDLKDDSTIKRYSRPTSTGRIEIIETPVGSLTTEIVDHKATGRDHIHKFAVETLDDIKTFTYINEHSFLIEIIRLIMNGRKGSAMMASLPPKVPLLLFRYSLWMYVVCRKLFIY